MSSAGRKHDLVGALCAAGVAGGVTGRELNRGVVQSSSLRFARAVQALGVTARSLGLVAPSFRSPPRLLGVQRSIKRWSDGAVVAVVVRGRPWAAVQADLVEGVIAANRLASPASDRARAALWDAIAASEDVEPEVEVARTEPGQMPHVHAA